MGNEASVPEAGSPEDLEEQARAPPSAFNPPPSPPPKPKPAPRAGARVIGAVFGNTNKANHAAEQPYDDKSSSSRTVGAAAVFVDGQTETTGEAESNGETEHPEVGVMYEKTPSKKSLFPARATARGAALISSMRNLSLGGALRSSGSKKGVDNWEKQWDEDDEEDSDGEEDISSYHTAAHSLGESSVAVAATPIPPMRPGMDASHSDLGVGGGPLSPHPHLTPPEATKLAFVSPEVEAYNRSVSPTRSPPQTPSQYAISPTTSPAMAIAVSDVDDDGVEWDTGNIPGADMDMKPNVEMFMPMLRVLGKGSFGKVVLVQKRTGKESGGLFAMKILRKTHLVKRRQIERTRTERKVLSVVNHPFIMKLHYAFQTPDKLYLVLDYCPGGELFFHLSRFRRFPERVARFYSAELLLSIGHLHKRGIIYRDLKPENVLLDAEGHVKLGDFGLAKAGIKHPCEGASSMCGTPEYMAPEVLAQMGHGFCVDYWGLGMLLYEMMTGLPPWYTTDRAKLFRRLKSAPLDIPSYFSVHAAGCVGALLERNPRRRLGVTGIRTAMENDFFRNISWKSLYSRRVEAPIRPCEGWKPPDPSQADSEDDMMVKNGSHSAVPSMTFSDFGELDPNYLDAATSNFDNTFTRMPVESEDQPSNDDASAANELNDETFVGFSFDGSRDRERAASQSAASSNRLPSANIHHSHPLE